MESSFRIYPRIEILFSTVERYFLRVRTRGVSRTIELQKTEDFSAEFAAYLNLIFIRANCRARIIHREIRGRVFLLACLLFRAQRVRFRWYSFSFGARAPVRVHVLFTSTNTEPCRTRKHRVRGVRTNASTFPA